MALFSFFNKNTQQPENPEDAKAAPAVEPEQEPVHLPIEDATEREVNDLRTQQDIRRITVEKIDAIESEIARDILKAPPPVTPDTLPKTKAKENVDTPTDYQSTALFQTTLVRVDKETMILFPEDMDK